MQRTALLLTILLTILFFTNDLFAQTPAPEGGILSGAAGLAITKAGYGDQASPTKLSSIVGKIVKATLSLLGTVFLVLIVSGGYKWMMSGGNEEDVTKAKALILQAIIGLSIVIAAFLITNFVLGQLAQATG